MSESSLAPQVVRQFTEKGMTLGTAESLTAGLIAATVADVSGASAVLMGGVVSYDPRVKHEVLGVSQEVIDTVGVVSEACALQMADGARKLLKVDVALSATGVAGPTGGTAENPVGTVWLGVSTAEGTIARRFQFDGDRQSVRRQTVETALRLALDVLASK
ncbi:MAG: nicotinamide-nucleotide amidohydrolase family protein [Candidatus Limiplasma sp.]|nr:nicotinamide-nucleotide amidohydrolase family protein [Candidatus Limiplasma sp.]